MLVWWRSLLARCPALRTELHPNFNFGATRRAEGLSRWNRQRQLSFFRCFDYTYCDSLRLHVLYCSSGLWLYDNESAIFLVPHTTSKGGAAAAAADARNNAADSHEEEDNENVS